METKNVQHSEARYVYCVANYNKQDFNGVGIDGQRVYLVVKDELAAIVHDCLAKPYESKNEDQVKMWILLHHIVVEKAIEKFGSVIPFGFDTIIKGNEKNVEEWLEKENENLEAILKKIKGKSEFTIQIFLDDEVKKEIEKTDVEASKIKEQIETKPAGTAFMLKRKLEEMIREKMSIKAKDYSKILYETIAGIPDEIKQEKIKKIEDVEFKDKDMILNLSCLVDKSKVDKLSEALDKLSKIEHVFIRFTGPWAPYNFVEFGGIKDEAK